MQTWVNGHGSSPYPSKYAVYTGIHDLDNTTSSTTTRHLIDDIIVHEMYNDVTQDSDIALLKLSDQANFTYDTVNNVCLPGRGTIFEDGEMCYVSGWGSIYDGGPSYNILQEAAVPLISTLQCNTETNLYGHITPNMLCAGYSEGGVDACQGDSGGPLVCKRNGRWVLAGVTSWGDGCARPLYPGVYTKLTKCMNWIETKINQIFDEI
ncbi:transmembrane protease serine 3-like [Saccoglossus kowalevskii]|uniref:Enteropeptidase-like n=1 Tax=Saccoglossus kowalevskii TaxID=10224 RepID=A0ABM0H004_SACKO|nr:PREDICTED: enteropeptidase-like [Saccoglossus kowalevskii]